MYHCGFDPESIDMVVVRDLSFCLFDSTDPHEYFPERVGDVTIDLYEETVLPNTDEKYGTAVEVLTKYYKSYMKRGVSYLQKAKKLNSEWDERYLIGVDTTKQDKLIADIQKQLS